MRDVAKALAELIGATKCAAGKPADDPSMYQLKSAAKVMSGSMHVCTLTVWLSWMCAMRSLQTVSRCVTIIQGLYYSDGYQCISGCACVTHQPHSKESS